MFTDPDEYIPERYINHTKLANVYAGSGEYENRGSYLSVHPLTIDHYTYGSGRRICPGIHLAERNMFRIIAKILWGFNIEREINPATGEPFPIDNDAYNPGILQAPLPFKAKITPRSAKHVEVIKRERREVQDFLSQYE